MSDSRQAVLDMIQQLKDRLDDVQDAFSHYEGSCHGYAERLDRIDDRLFEIFEEFEAPLDSPEKTLAQKELGEEANSDAPVSDNPIIQAREDGKVIAKESAATIAELAGAVKDIRQALDFKSLLK